MQDWGGVDEDRRGMGKELLMEKEMVGGAAS